MPITHRKPASLSAPAISTENAAWATVAIPHTLQASLKFLANVERLFRLNPHLEIHHWQETSAAFVPGKQIEVKMLNEMNGVYYDVILTLESISDTSVRLSYNTSFKEYLEINIAAGPDNTSTLTLVERYRTLPAEEHQQRLSEVDRGLSLWAVAIRQYLIGMQRWQWLWPYRWYREGFWLKMIPRHRRIARLIWWTTLLEFIVFIFVAVIYWLEAARKIPIT